MKNFSLICMLLFANLSLFSQEEIHEIRLPECKGMTFPKVHLEEDGFYKEYETKDSSQSQVRYTYSIKDGDREGPLKIYSEEGELIGEGYFSKNRLKDGVLKLYDGREVVELVLEYDAPTWFFQKNWRQASGSQQTIDGKSYVWLACQRYRLPEDVERLNLN